MIIQPKTKGLNCKPVTEKDTDVLFTVYSSTRLEEMRLLTNWSEQQKDSFLRFQFHAQHTFYQQQYKGGHFWVIEHRKTPIGRLYVHEQYEGNSIRIIDITLLPEYRNKGFGTDVISQVLEYGKKVNRSVTLHVDVSNPAMILYEKLGFKKVHQKDLRFFMEWVA